jgi:hypothetical protein
MPVDFAKFAAVLRDLGVVGEVKELPESAPTAATAAAQLGCEVGAIANSLVFSADGAPLLVMTSGAHRVDTVRVATDPSHHPSRVRRIPLAPCAHSSSLTYKMTSARVARSL